MTFEDKWILWVSLPLFLLWLALFLHGLFYRQGAAVRFSQVGRLKRLKPPRILWLRRLLQLSRIAVILLLLLAMARPQTGRKHTRIITEGIDIMLVLDTSGSMRALDLESEKKIQDRQDRLEISKDVVRKFIHGRKNDQIGLVVFGEDAYTQCPLTLDHGILLTLLERIEIGMAGDRTALGSALGTAVKRLKDSQAKSKIIILLTDGRNNAGSLSPIKAAEVAASFGIKVYTIGVGTRDKAPFIVDSGLFGKRIHYENVEIDEAVLQKVAETTEGHYYRATDAGSLKAIYDTIDKLERTEIEVKTYLEYDERFGWFVFPALLVLLLEIVLLGTRLRKIP